MARCSIEGPPGIGKTRLLGCAARRRARMFASSWRASASSSATFRSRSRASCSSVPSGNPAKRRDGSEPALEPELLTGAAALAAPVRQDSAAAVEAGPAALHGLYWLTANLAARAPLLVLVDDLHWADLASLRWLAYLVQRLDGMPVAVVAAARPDDAGDGQQVLDVLATHPAVTVLHPGGLSEEAVGRVVERALGPADPAFVAACREVTGGNPFLRRRARARARRTSLRPPPAPRSSRAADVAHGQPRRARAPAPSSAGRAGRSPAPP